MYDIPVRFGLFVPPLSGVMVAEAIHGSIPERHIQFDQRGFDGADHVRAGILKNNKSAGEVLKLQSLGDTDASAVFPQAANEFFGLTELFVGSPRLPPALGYCLADIYRVTIRSCPQLT